MRKRRNITALVLSLAMLLCACSAPAENENKSQAKAKEKPEEEKEYQGNLDMIQPAAYNNIHGLDLEPGSYISVIGKSGSGQYWEAVEKGALQAAADLNGLLGYEGKDKIKVTYSGAATADDVDEQVNILDEELARYPVALAIAVTDARACEVQFDLAAESDIPVVAFDSGSDYQGLMSTVATDNDKSARFAAVKLADYMGQAGEAVVVVHDSKSKTALQREQAFQDEMQKSYPNIAIMETYHMDQADELKKTIADEINNGTYVKGGRDGADEEQPSDAEQNEIQADSITEDDIIDYILAKHPNVTGCFATNEDAAELTLEGVGRLAQDKVSVVGFDASSGELEALSEGKLDGLIVQNPFGMGYAAVVAAGRSALGQGNEAYVDTGYFWLTKRNMNDEDVKKLLY